MDRKPPADHDVAREKNSNGERGSGATEMDSEIQRLRREVRRLKALNERNEQQYRSDAAELNEENRELQQELKRERIEKELLRKRFRTLRKEKWRFEQQFMSAQHKYDELEHFIDKILRAKDIAGGVAKELFCPDATKLLFKRECKSEKEGNGESVSTATTSSRTDFDREKMKEEEPEGPIRHSDTDLMPPPANRCRVKENLGPRARLAPSGSDDDDGSSSALPTYVQYEQRR